MTPGLCVECEDVAFDPGRDGPLEQERGPAQPSTVHEGFKDA
jgi:hypothetical protein